MQTKKYTVTKKAGLWVAGKRSPGIGNTMELTAEEARYGLIHGELEAPDQDAGKAPEAAKPAAKSNKAGA